MSWNTGSIAEYASYLIDAVPSTISGTVMQKMAELSVRQVENFTGQSIGLTGIDSKYHSMLANITAGYTAARMAGVGADFSYQLGEFRVDKGASTNPLISQSASFFSMANSDLKSLGQRTSFKKALG